MKFNKALIGLAAMLAVAGAQAATSALPPGSNLGTNPDTVSFYGLSSGSSSTYSFTLASVATPGYITTWDLSSYFTSLFGPVNISGITVTGPSFSETQTPAFLDDTAMFTGLSDGAYTIKFDTTSASTGILVGTLKATAVLTPVPEPESLALMLAGLGVAGTLLRRRKNA